MARLLVIKQAGLAPSGDMSRAELGELRDKRATEFGIEVLGDGNSNLTFPAGEPTTLEQYADPVNLKYRIDDKAHAANARARFAQSFKVYGPQSRPVIIERIIRAALRFGIKPAFDPENYLDGLLPADLREQLTEKQMSKSEAEAEAAAKAEEEEAAKAKEEEEAEAAKKAAEEEEAARKAKAEEGEGDEAAEAAAKAKAEEEEAAKAKEEEEAEAAAKTEEEEAGKGEPAEKQDHAAQMTSAIQLLEQVDGTVTAGKTMDPGSSAKLKKAIEILKASMTTTAKKADEAEAAEKAGRQQMSVARGKQAMNAIGTLIKVLQEMIPESERKGWPTRKADDEQVAEEAKAADLQKAADAKAVVEGDLEKANGEIAELKKQLKAAENIAAPSNGRTPDVKREPTEKAADDATMPFDANDPEFLNS